MKRISVTHVAVLLVLVCSGVAVWAQSENGRITGTVTDSTGAVVSGATMNVTSQATARVVTVQSGSAGEYSVNALKPGPYKLEVTAPNFKTVTQDVTVAVGQAQTLNFTLTTGTVSETVQVSSEAPMVETTTSGMG